MKIKTVVLVCLLTVMVLPFAYEYSWGKSEVEETTSNIGVVSIRKVFQDCRRNVIYRQKAQAEQEKIVAELQKLDAEIEAEKAGLKTLKVGSSDYMTSTKEILMKQAKIQAQKQFHQQRLALKDQGWTEQLYKDILRIIKQVAAEKGLAVVLEASEPELPATSAERLVSEIRTHKVLYSGGCVDISDEVLAQLDADN